MSMPSGASSIARPTPSTIRLARQIVALAAMARWPAGRHITEAELAGQLGLSRTPVRAALRLLADHAVVEARPNQGFFLLKEGLGLDAFDLEHVPTAVEILYGQVLRDRIAGAIPQEITQPVLAARYGAGRTILTQVLARLADDALIARSGGRSWRFIPTLTDQNSVRASYAFRIAVEPSAILSDGYRMPHAGLLRLRERHVALIERLAAHGETRSGTIAPLRAVIVGLDADFHEALSASSGNPFLESAIRQHMSLRRLLEFGVQEQASRVLVWCREHLAIIDALLDGDRRLAVDHLCDHLTKALKRSVSVRRQFERRA